MTAYRHYPLVGAALFLLGLLATGNATAGIHTWDIVEVFSNADGTVQYIELEDLGAGGNEVNIGNATLSSASQSYAFGNGPVAPPTNGKFYLIATPDFVGLAGAPTPDVILPADKVPFFDPAGDTLSVGVDSFTFGPVPTDGIDALTRAGGTTTNTPTNYAGITGTIDASPEPPPSVPLFSGPAVSLTLVSLTLAALALLRRASGPAS